MFPAPLLSPCAAVENSTEKPSPPSPRITLFSKKGFTAASNSLSGGERRVPVGQAGLNPLVDWSLACIGIANAGPCPILHLLVGLCQLLLVLSIPYL
ncbi:hypothetical protein J5N97_016847 [Dioscorea zingiberensis]|uniref:Uncharacterized protein n=1 Tax=Dioscorea zingiberensis TaxID=325984 RepID=A0A9D5HG17_9LILI|nr:hypothetical protein J5N97_016847 [Dioscorea zingiberensis]